MKECKTCAHGPACNQTRLGLSPGWPRKGGWTVNVKGGRARILTCPRWRDPDDSRGRA